MPYKAYKAATLLPYEQNSEETDYFEVVSPKTAMKTLQFIRDKFLTSKHSNLLSAKGLETSSLENACLLCYGRSTNATTNSAGKMSLNAIKKTVNEELLVRKFHEKIKHMSKLAKIK